MSEWTDDRIETLKRLWIAGKSAKQIGALLGVSRSAIIGKINRLPELVRDMAGMSPTQVARYNGPAAHVPRSTMPKTRSTATREDLAAHNLRRKMAAPIYPLPPENAPAPSDVATVRLVDLTHRHCRWPIGDPQDASFGFCGGWTEGVYCGDHARVAYQAAKPLPVRAFAINAGRARRAA